MKTTYSFQLILYCLIFLFSCDKEDEVDALDTSTTAGVEATLNGSWDLAQPMFQYLNEAGEVLQEMPQSNSSPGEFNFDKGTHSVTVVEQDGYSFVEAYVVTSSSDKYFLTLGTDPNTTTVEMAFPASNQMIWTGFNSSNAQYVDDDGNVQTAATTKYYAELTKK